MEQCPHCGEPIAEDATFCRHCGSDAETGWNPDADYYSMELPEEDEEEEKERQHEVSREEIRERIAHLLGPALVALAWVFFVVYGYSKFDPPLLVLIPALYLAVSFTVLARLVGKKLTVDG